MSQMRDGTAYLQVRRAPGWGASLRVVKSTQRRPEVIEPGCVVVKIVLRLPSEAFEPLSPEAVVTVPTELVQRTIEVEAVDPT